MQVLSVLWEHGPLPVREALQRLPDGKKRAYTTVLSVMQVMEKKGLLDHRREGATHVYRPLVTRRQICRPLMRDLVRNVFGGSAAAAMQYLLSDAEVSDDELSEIRRLIDQAGQGSPPKREEP